MREAVLDLARAARRSRRGDQRRAVPDARRNSRRTRRASASTMARCSPMRAGRGATPRSSTSRRRPRWRNCSADAAGAARQHASRSPSDARSRSSSAAPMLPAYPVPAGSTTEDFLREESRRGTRDAARADGGVGTHAARPVLVCGPARDGTRRDLQHGLRGLLSDRRRLHPLGARATACRWGRAAARARDPWSPSSSASRISIRSSTTCCSSGS